MFRFGVSQYGATAALLCQIRDIRQVICPCNISVSSVFRTVGNARPSVKCFLDGPVLAFLCVDTIGFLTSATIDVNRASMLWMLSLATNYSVYEPGSQAHLAIGSKQKKPLFGVLSVPERIHQESHPPRAANHLHCLMCCQSFHTSQKKNTVY